jgi:streptogramin lyase
MNRLLAIALFALLAHSARAQDSVITLAGLPLITGLTNGAATNAVFNDPAALACDALGNIYIADSQNHVIRKIDTQGAAMTLAAAQFDTPSGIAVAPDGVIYVSDTGNHTIRRMTPEGSASIFAGALGQSGFIDALGSAARFNSPLGLAVASNGTVYVADCGNHSIRAIAPNGTVTTFAGNTGDWGTADGSGSNVHFNGPVGLAFDDQGNLFVSDSNNHAIRKITPAGVVSTWAGLALSDGYVDGDRLTARFAKPAELAFDRHGNLFVADSFNHVIRKITPAGKVETVAGLAGSHGSASGINGQARLFNPYGLAIRPDGSLVISDAYNELIRLVTIPVTLQIDRPALLSWNSVIGKTYQVQYRDSLDSAAAWTNLQPPIIATNLTTIVDGTVSATANPPAQRIYRALWNN